MAHEEKKIHTELSRKSRYWRKWIHWFMRPKIAIPIIIFVLFVVTPIAYRQIQISRIPDIDQPFDFAKFIHVKIPAHQNAFEEYTQAANDYIEYQGNDRDYEQAMESRGTVTTPEIDRWVDENETSLSIWFSGTLKPDAQHLDSWLFSSDPPKVVTHNLLNLVRIVHLKAARLRSEKKFKETQRWLLAGLTSSRHTGNRSVIDDRLVGVTMHKLMCDSLIDWANEREVNEELLRSTLNEVRTIYKDTIPWSEVLKHEYVAFISGLKYDSFEELTLNRYVFKTRREYLMFKVNSWLNGDPEVSIRATKLIYRNWVKHVDKPKHSRLGDYGFWHIPIYADSPETLVEGCNFSIKEFSQLCEQRMVPKLVGSAPVAEKAHLRERAYQYCLETVLAAQIYERQHGKFPEKIVDLEPILGEIPINPFATDPNDKIRFRKEKEGFSIWSIGDDGIDNGGDFEHKKDYTIPDYGFRIKRPLK